MLQAWLDFHRTTLLSKLADLDASQLRTRAVPPSALSLLGLLRHMSEVERSWFRRLLAGEDSPKLYCSDSDPDGDFDGVDTADPDEAFATFRAEVERCDRVARSYPSLDAVGAQRRHGSEVSLRWIYVHMIEEYARHNGHADLLRERIDGRTGD